MFTMHIKKKLLCASVCEKLLIATKSVYIVHIIFKKKFEILHK